MRRILRTSLIEVSALEAQGKDTSAIDPEIDRFSEKVAAARTAYDAAQAELAGITNMKDEASKAKLEDAKKLVREARDDVMEAYGILKSLVKDIKAQGGDFSSCVGSVDELVAEYSPSIVSDEDAVADAGDDVDEESEDPASYSDTVVDDSDDGLVDSEDDASELGAEDEDAESTDETTPSS